MTVNVHKHSPTRREKNLKARQHATDNQSRYHCMKLAFLNAKKEPVRTSFLHRHTIKTTKRENIIYTSNYSRQVCININTIQLSHRTQL